MSSINFINIVNLSRVIGCNIYCIYTLFSSIYNVSMHQRVNSFHTVAILHIEQYIQCVWKEAFIVQCWHLSQWNEKKRTITIWTFSIIYSLQMHSTEQECKRNYWVPTVGRRFNIYIIHLISNRLLFPTQSKRSPFPADAIEMFLCLYRSR